MEEQKNGFEERAMKYLDWDNKPVVEEEQPKEPEQPAPVVEEQSQQEHEETQEEMYEKLQKEQQEQYKKLQEQQEEAMKRVRENMNKAWEDAMKAYGLPPMDIDINQIMDDMMNMKEEDIVTPESDKVFLAWVDLRFPGLIEQARENVLKKIQKQKEEQEKYMQQVSGIFS